MSLGYENHAEISAIAHEIEDEEEEIPLRRRVKGIWRLPVTQTSPNSPSPGEQKRIIQTRITDFFRPASETESDATSVLTEQSREEDGLEKISDELSLEELNEILEGVVAPKKGKGGKPKLLDVLRGQPVINSPPKKWLERLGSVPKP